MIQIFITLVTTEKCSIQKLYLKQKSSELHKNIKLKTFFIQEKIGSENGPFTQMRDLKTDSKIKNYDEIFHTHSAANEFIWK